MDQYVSVFGRRARGDRNRLPHLEHRYVQLPDAVSLVAVNSMVKHALGASAYRERVQECAAVEKIKQRFHMGESLLDVSVEQFEAVEKLLPPLIARRARHVITANEPVNVFVDAGLDIKGQLVVESHRSLQYDYEVSCEEL